MTKTRTILDRVRHKAMITWEIWLGILGFVTNLIVLAIGGTWALGRQSNKLEMALRDEHEIFRREFGESLSALRQKINDVELWSRDEFIRREDFYRIVDGINGNITGLGDKIDARNDRLEEILRSLPRPATP
jgi:hypothetical protein